MYFSNLITIFAFTPKLSGVAGDIFRSQSIIEGRGGASVFQLSNDTFQFFLNLTKENVF